MTKLPSSSILHDATSLARFIWAHPSNRSKRTRQLLRAASFQARARLLGHRQKVLLGDRSYIWAELHHTASTKALYAKPPDWPEMLVWQRELAPGDLFVDVGANIGSYSIIAAERGAHVLAIEPDAEAAARLRENIMLNGYDIDVRELVLSDRAGWTTFTEGLDTVNHLCLEEVVASGMVTHRVMADTLDALLEHRHAAGVKIDVEGAETLVLRGADGALSEGRIRLLQLEWNAASRQLIGQGRAPLARLLADYGYELTRPNGSGQLQRIRDTEDGSDVCLPGWPDRASAQLPHFVAQCSLRMAAGKIDVQRD